MVQTNLLANPVQHQGMVLLVYDPVRMMWVVAGEWREAPKVVNVEYEQRLRINASFSYTGPRWTGYLYGAIGSRRGWAFDEIVRNTSRLSLAETRTPRTFTASVDIPITTALAPGRHYSIYVKIIDEAGRDMAISPFLENAIFVVEVVPRITDLVITDYHVANVGIMNSHAV